MITKFSKQRLIGFTDGVIAIIITIMILNIPLPSGFDHNELTGFLGSIFTFFISFFIVASQWNKHHHIFDGITEITNKIIWRNFLFLFFLSLLPVFTKLVMENMEEVFPIIGYDVVYILVNLSFQFLFNSMIDKKRMNRELREIRRQRVKNIYAWLQFSLMIAAMTAFIILSFFYPRVSLVFFIGFPVVSSLFNMLFENNRTYGRYADGRVDH